jgi:tetratricopeptide (TPR) repeat protein
MHDMNKEQQFNIIEAYLKGTHPPEDRAAVEQEIASNPEAALELQLQQVELDAMEVLLEQDLRNKASRWLAEDDATPPPTTPGDAPPAPRTRRFSPWPFVGLGIIAVLAVLIWQTNPGTTTPPELEDKKIEPPSVQDADPSGPIAEPSIPAESTSDTRPPVKSAEKRAVYAAAESFYEDLPLSNVRNGEPRQTDEDPLAATTRAYEQKQFRQALTLLNEVPAGNSSAVRALELKAHILYQLRNYEESAKLFAEVTAKGLAPFDDRSQWNQLVCYYMLYPDSKAELQALLSALLNDENHPYHEKAIELQAKLPR